MIMLQHATPASASKTPESDNPSFGLVTGDLSKNLVILCDHARNTVPAKYRQLGLPEGEFERHIAYDIGAEALTLSLAHRLGVPAVCAHFSRLLIDPNRGVDDPTLIMKISDGALVAGNLEVDAKERQHRINAYYQPYHDAIGRLVGQARAQSGDLMILSVHSFTPFWKGVPRPWHVGVLWEEEDSFARPLINALSRDASLVVGENEPYSGGVEGETVEKHARRAKIPAALIEVRQDLIADQTGVEEWADRLAQILSAITVRG